jgi:hypothetical protein
MALSTQDLKELAQRALRDDNLEAAKFLINSALQRDLEPVPTYKQLPISNLAPSILNLQETDLALIHYLSKHTGEEVRFSQIANHFRDVYGHRLDQTWISGESRPKWRQLISKGLNRLRDTGLLTKGEMRTSHVVCTGFTALLT